MSDARSLYHMALIDVHDVLIQISHVVALERVSASTPEQRAVALGRLRLLTDIGDRLLILGEQKMHKLEEQP